MRSSDLHRQLEPPSLQPAENSDKAMLVQNIPNLRPGRVPDLE